MVENTEDSAADVKFWSSYRFFIDPRYCTLEVLKDQPQGRTSVKVPHAQWRAVVESFDRVGLELLLKDSGEDEGWKIRREMAQADAAANLSPPDTVRLSADRSNERGSFSQKLDASMRKQADAYKRFVLWRAKHRIDEATGAIDPWLREPEIQRGIRFAYETNDEKFFKSLGRILSAKPKPAKPLPIGQLFAKNWIDGELRLAIFSDTALAQLCVCMSEQWQAKQTFTKDAIIQRRIEYRLETLGSIAYRKADSGLSKTVGPVINQIRWTSQKIEFESEGKPIRLHELVAASR